MSHRRRKKKALPQTASPPVTAARAIIEATLPPSRETVLGELFAKVLTKVNDRARFTDRIAPMAVFVYGNENDPGLFYLKAVHVRWRNDIEKETIRKKIHDKASIEDAAAVILLTKTEPTQGFLLSGATPHLHGDASVTYTCDTQTGAFTFSEIVWLNEPLQGFFLDGIRLKG